MLWDHVAFWVKAKRLTVVIFDPNHLVTVLANVATSCIDHSSNDNLLVLNHKVIDDTDRNVNSKRSTIKVHQQGGVVVKSKSIRGRECTTDRRNWNCCNGCG